MAPKTKILFVGERWCDAKPGTVLSNSSHNILGSLDATGTTEVTSLFTDEVVASGGTVDLSLIALLTQQSRPDLIFITPTPAFPVINPTPNVLSFIADKWGTPIVAMYYDTAQNGHIAYADTYGKTVDVNIALDNYSIYATDSKFPDKWMPLWTPQDLTLFHDEIRAKDRDIEVSFLGSVNFYDERRDFLALLERTGVPVTIGGGQREHKWPVEKYAAMLRRSQISLNFSEVAGSNNHNHQFKGRVLESMLCGALVLEPDNRQTSKWFTPGVHYDTFGSSQELLSKIQFYRDHKEVRVAMAKRGCQRARTEFTAQAFWNTVFKRVGIGSTPPKD